MRIKDCSREELTNKWERREETEERRKDEKKIRSRKKNRGKKEALWWCKTCSGITPKEIHALERKSQRGK